MKQLVAMMVAVLILMTGCATQDRQPDREPITETPTSETTVPPVTQPSETTPIAAPSSEETPIMSKGSLPAETQQAVLSAVAAEQNVAADQLQVSAVEEADWPDACLGLASPDEMCAQMITPGWAVTVTDGQTTWQYRTDLDASQVKLES